jgi:hypothetical protein
LVEEDLGARAVRASGARWPRRDEGERGDTRDEAKAKKLSAVFHDRLYFRSS